MTNVDHSTESGERFAGAELPPNTRAVNGVFKGGGAKGIAYAGALAALEEQGIWFRSVAGTSAGAITATLIAAGMRPDEIAEAVPEGLDAIRSSTVIRVAKAVMGHATTLFESDKARAWLDQRLAAKIGRSEPRPVTFLDLYEATHIELYVVAMDLSNGLPVVFCRRTTPHVEVAGAVFSSSAIPGGLPPGRAVFKTVGDGAVVHQLVDGGTWANYPAFVFDDSSFREWIRCESIAAAEWTDEERAAWDEECARPTVGFILGDPNSPQHRQPLAMVPLDGPLVNRRFDQGPTYTSEKAGNYLFGSTLSSDWARLVIGVALLAWFALSIATLPIGARRFAAWLGGWAPDTLYPMLLVGSLALITLSALVAMLTVGALVVMGRLLADTLLPSLKALMGVPTDVPPWVGLGADSVVIRVPFGELRTMGFGVDEATRTAAIEGARQAVAEQLAAPATIGRLEALFGGSAGGGSHPVTVPPIGSEQAIEEPGRFVLYSALLFVTALGAVGVLAWWATNAAATRDILTIVGVVTIGVIAGTAAMLYAALRTGRRANLRSRFGVLAGPSRASAAPYGLMALAAGLVIGSIVVAGAAMEHRNESTVPARIIAAEVVAGEKQYVAQRTDGNVTPVEFQNDRSLRLGERVLIALDTAEGNQLSGPLDDRRFAVSIVLLVLGLSILTAGVRLRNWQQRCDRLAALLSPQTQ